VVGAALVALARGLYAVARKPGWADVDRRIQKALVRVADLQFVVGLFLYVVLSPIVRSAIAEPKAAMKSAALRFFFVEHITAMVIALAVLHIGAGRIRQATDDRVRHRRMLTTSVVFCLCIVIGIPWPFRPYGRPLARTDLASPALVTATKGAPELYERRCAVCHGPAGRGDGVAATSMQPAPRDLTLDSWQARVSDEQLRHVIKRGGTAAGLSANMPPHGDLSDDEIQTLVTYVRSTARAGSAR
jgi:mono/diheme cytochrome c family protein